MKTIIRTHLTLRHSRFLCIVLFPPLNYVFSISCTEGHFKKGHTDVHADTKMCPQKEVQLTVYQDVLDDVSYTCGVSFSDLELPGCLKSEITSASTL